MKRRLLDLAACEGGATAGYQRAGWHVTAVDTDKAALARNPADVKIQADALEYLANEGRNYHAAHASFPCQRWSANGANPSADKWPDLITPGRVLLEASGLAWVMENVPKAPLRQDLLLCGSHFAHATRMARNYISNAIACLRAMFHSSDFLNASIHGLFNGPVCMAAHGKTRSRLERFVTVAMFRLMPRSRARCLAALIG